MVKIVTVEQMKAIEKATDAAGVSYAEMMQHAGRAVAEVIKGTFEDDSTGRRIAVLVGPGNNGGDGLVAARILAEETDVEVGCYLLAARPDSDEVYTAAVGAGVFVANAEDDQRWRVLKNLVGNADVVVDALLGTGARLPIEGDLAKILNHAASVLQKPASGDLEGDPLGVVWPSAPIIVDRKQAFVVAVDCPSGLNCDTGEIDPLALPADITVTFAAAKPGQLTFPGAAAVGELIVAGIGTPANLDEAAGINLELATGSGVARLLPERGADSHKGTYGRALLVAGSVNYTGAAALAALGAYRAGAGLVTLAVPQPIYPILAASIREATWLLLPHTMGIVNGAALDVLKGESGDFDAMLLGPGLSQEEDSLEFVRGLLQGERRAKKGSLGFAASRVEDQDAQAGWELDVPLLIDADGLNLLAQIDDWSELVPTNTILTPHPGEMSRLTGMAIDQVNADRIGIATEKAREWKCVVVLKGAFTIIAGPDGQATVLPFAVDALATAGTGDVLSGLIVGLLAQGVAPYEAAVAGGYVHGLAGRIAGDNASSRSVIAGDVLAAIPDAFTLLAQ